MLFGSAARGDAGSASDLDRLVVRRDSRRPAARTDDLYRRIGARVAIDLIVYTPEELAAAAMDSSFVRQLLCESEVPYE